MEVRKMFMMSDLFWQVVGQVAAGAAVLLALLF